MYGHAAYESVTSDETTTRVDNGTTKSCDCACMSFTAPQFSLQDEQEERDSLSHDEREALRQDLHGYTAIRRETPELMHECLQKVEQALQNEIAAPQKEAYLQALQEAAPEETDPLIFVRAEDYHSEAAALRMVNYWNERKAFFGERAFAPLQQLIDEERERQRQQQQQGDDGVDGNEAAEQPFPHGNHTRLPTDEFGRSVVFSPESRPQDPLASLRHSFLLFHHLVHQNSYVQRHGCVLLVDARAIDPAHFDRKQYRKKLQHLREVVPIRIRAIHVCFAAFKSAARLLQPSILWMYGRNLRLRRCVHYGTSKALALSLQDYGLELNGIPSVLGGSFAEELVDGGGEGETGSE